MDITIEEIQNKLKNLPEDLRWAIMNANIDEKILSLGKVYGLTIEQMGQLSLETYMVILNYTQPNKFEESLKQSLGLQNDKNRQIATDINNQILRDIKGNLMSLSEKEEIPDSIALPGIRKEALEGKTQKESVKDILNQKINESISSQKLFNTFQSPTKKTEYSLNNLSKDNEKTRTFTDQNVKISDEATTKTASSSYPSQEDPYRLKPE